MSKAVVHKSGTVGLRVLLMVTCFFIGLLIGMVIIHVVDSKSLPEEIAIDVSKEDAAPAVTNVYIPARKREFGRIPIHSYIVDNFQLEDGFMVYKDASGNKISHLGVDLSSFNQNINWNELKDSQVEFVMLRCGYRGYTEGGLIEDDKFREYAKAANEVGIPVGVYFFTQAIDVEEAAQEAEFVLDLVKDLKISYPIALDMEYIDDEKARTNTNEISDELRSNMAITFCEKIREAGYYPMIYSAENWMRRDMDVTMLSDYDVWAAMYRDENDFLFDFTMWQYTDSGYVPGIPNKVDLDISMVDYASFVPALRDAIESGGQIINLQ